MEKPSNEVIQKANLLVERGKVRKDVETDKRIHFTVEGESETHSVIFEKGKGEWKCDCKFSSLHQKRCSHILACISKKTKLI
ncbi:MAG: hypothetical protein HYT70_03230 [Candidatus Aenigmarchaeota archaeon]|nr:hypothetical protein [Candidatus Aenigmarchaeota archaeon]